MTFSVRFRFMTFDHKTQNGRYKAGALLFDFSFGALNWSFSIEVLRPRMFLTQPQPEIYGCNSASDTLYELFCGFQTTQKEGQRQPRRMSKFRTILCLETVSLFRSLSISTMISNLLTHAAQICSIKQPARLGEPAQMVVNYVSHAGQLARELMMMWFRH